MKEYRIQRKEDGHWIVSRNICNQSQEIKEPDE